MRHTLWAIIITTGILLSTLPRPALADVVRWGIGNPQAFFAPSPDRTPSPIVRQTPNTQWEGAQPCP
jgi:hypothetical protein